MSGVVRIEIRETTKELKTLMRKEKDVLRHEKLQLLYWLKTKTVDSVLFAAVRLGKYRTTIQRWLSSYGTGGIEELLCQKPRAGRPRIMTPEIVDKLSEELNQVEIGRASCRERV